MIQEFLLILIFGIADLLTTKAVLNLGGDEFNDIMKYFLKRYGFSSLIIIKAIAITYLILFGSRFIIYAIFFGTIAVIGNTTALIQRYRFMKERNISGKPKIMKSNV